MTNFIIKKKKKNLFKLIKLIVPAGQASVAPPLGPLLGQFGINIIDFCNQFNSRTWYITEGLAVLVDLKFFPSRKEFFFDLNGPMTSVLLNDNSFYIDGINKKKIYKASLLKCKNKFFSKLLCKMWLGSLKSYNIILLK